MVPPGFVPDPEYTWVPRTQVQEWTRTTTPTTTTVPTTTPTTTDTTVPPTTTTPTTPIEPTGPTDTPVPGQQTPAPAEVTPPTTTVVDPDGPNGLLPPDHAAGSARRGTRAGTPDTRDTAAACTQWVLTRVYTGVP